EESVEAARLQHLPSESTSAVVDAEIHGTILDHRIGDEREEAVIVCGEDVAAPFHRAASVQRLNDGFQETTVVRDNQATGLTRNCVQRKITDRADAVAIVVHEEQRLPLLVIRLLEPGCQRLDRLGLIEFIL